MTKLRFLDSYEVTKQEKEMISQEALFYDVVKLKDHNLISEIEHSEDSKASASSNQYTPLPNKNAENTSETPTQGMRKFFVLVFKVQV